MANFLLLHFSLRVQTFVLDRFWESEKWCLGACGAIFLQAVFFSVSLEDFRSWTLGSKVASRDQRWCFSCLWCGCGINLWCGWIQFIDCMVRGPVVGSVSEFFPYALCGMIHMGTLENTQNFEDSKTAVIYSKTGLLDFKSVEI